MKKIILFFALLAPMARAESMEQIADKIGKIFQDVMESRPPSAAQPFLRRPVFLKPHGCAKATFVPIAGLSKNLAQGVFASPVSHDAWVRISSDTVPSVKDTENKTVGIAIKVLDVPGRKILKGEENDTTQDFILQNHPVFFSDTAQDFLEFMQAIVSGTVENYLDTHPTTKRIDSEMAKPVASVLHSEYWSGLPSKLGQQKVKYRLVPLMPPPNLQPIPADAPNYLRDRFVHDMRKSGGRFELQVQIGTKKMPVDRATVLWEEAEAPFQTVAYIVLHQGQDVTQHDLVCERMSFSAWHSLPEHRPLGSIQEARRIVYKRMADIRLKR